MLLPVQCYIIVTSMFGTIFIICWKYTFSHLRTHSIIGISITYIYLANEKQFKYGPVYLQIETVLNALCYNSTTALQPENTVKIIHSNVGRTSDDKLASQPPVCTDGV